MPTVRNDPRISINSMAEYLGASASRRQRIVEEQKRPPTFRVNWYQFAQDAITSFIVGGCTDESILTNETTRLSRAAPVNDYEETRFQTNGEALTSFLDTYDELDLTGLTIVAGPPDQPKLLYSNVEVSVRPEIHLRGNHPRHGDFTGALKLFFSKNAPLDADGAAYTTAVLYCFVQRHLAASAPARKQQCLVFDVFAGDVYSTPNASTRRINDVNAACREIALMWPTA